MRLHRKKRVFSSLLATACILIGFCTTLYAGDNSSDAQKMTRIAVEATDILIDVPTDCYVLQQEIAEDDPYIQKMGADREQIMAYFQEAGIVLNVMDKNEAYEIVVTVNQNQNVNYIYNMQSLDEQQIEEFAETICDTYRNYGYQVEDYEIYETEDAKYVLLGFGQKTNEGQMQCRQYYTIRGNRIYNYTLRSYLGEITPKMEEMMSGVMESIAYGEAEQVLVQEDKGNGVTFFLQQGWEQISSVEQDSYSALQYMHSNGLGESIQLISIDMWGSLNVLRQFLNTRTQLDMQQEPTKEDIARYQPYIMQFFSSDSQLELREINGNWYFVSEEPLEIQSENLQDLYYQNSVVTIREGIIYAFQYGRYEGNDLHEHDFEELLDSVAYSQSSFLDRDEEAYQKMANTAYMVMAVAFLLLVGLGITGFLYINKTFYKES